MKYFLQCIFHEHLGYTKNAGKILCLKLIDADLEMSKLSFHILCYPFTLNGEAIIYNSILMRIWRIYVKCNHAFGEFSVSMCMEIQFTR